MQGLLFAAIDVGSYELAMKIFELSKKKGIKEIDHIVHRIDIGTDTYATGRISRSHIMELCRILKDFRSIMDGYRVTDYLAYGTSAMRETTDIRLVLEIIKKQSGVDISVISNSEQRFLDYKAIALRSEEFVRIIEKPAAILDIGGGGSQISIFDKDKLISTQNMRLGVLRLNQVLQSLSATPEKYDSLIAELISTHIGIIKKLYLQGRDIKNLIVVDDYISPVIKKMRSGGNASGYVDRDAFEERLGLYASLPQQEVSKELELELEQLNLVRISAYILLNIAKETGARLIWAPGVTLCDGMAYEYAEKNKLISPDHDFEQDIIACALNISKRYMGSKKRSATLWSIALNIFDATKKIHGLGKREKLLLRIAVILHDCGKFISLVNMGECCYSIIISTEIIGLSHNEREMVANIVRFNHRPFETFTENPDRYANFGAEGYLIIAKLTAILRLANALDRTHREKFKDMPVKLKDNNLVINVDSSVDVSIEKSMLFERASFFEQVYGLTPVIKQKKKL